MENAKHGLSVLKLERQQVIKLSIINKESCGNETIGAGFAHKRNEITQKVGVDGVTI